MRYFPHFRFLFFCYLCEKLIDCTSSYDYCIFGDKEKKCFWINKTYFWRSFRVKNEVIVVNMVSDIKWLFTNLKYYYDLFVTWRQDNDVFFKNCTGKPYFWSLIFFVLFVKISNYFGFWFQTAMVSKVKSIKPIKISNKTKFSALC